MKYELKRTIRRRKKNGDVYIYIYISLGYRKEGNIEEEERM